MQSGKITKSCKPNFGLVFKVTAARILLTFVSDMHLMFQGTENIHPDKLLTDRSTYIGYLESQLERVTSACLTVQSFDQRIETVTTSARLLEEKVHCCRI